MKHHGSRHALRRVILLALILATSLVCLPESLADDLALAHDQTWLRKLDRDEKLLADAMDAMRAGQLDAALHQIEALLRIQPDFRLAQLIRGDLLLAHAQTLDTIGNTNLHTPALDSLREEARARLDSLLAPPPAGQYPEQILQLSTSIHTALIVDTEKSRLYVFANQPGGLHYLADFYVTIGRKGAGKAREGDERTPLGVYSITGHLSGKKLPDTYGPQAFPLSFPNDWDHMQGIGGHGIWLHGTFSGTYSRPPHASDGCVVLTNNDLDSLAQYLTPGNTIVVITDRIRWVDKDHLDKRRTAALNMLHQWQNDWESLDTNRYLSEYASQFTADGTPFGNWAANKRRVNQTKSWIKVNLDNLSLFEYPGSQRMLMADFVQDYRSNNLNNQMHKHQYWIQQDDHWKIIAENGV